MGRSTGPKCRLCRREGEKLFLTGQTCYTEKCPVARRKTPPGLPARGRSRQSQYAVHVREKQKLKRMYGVREGQFRRYVDVAKRAKGIAGDNLLQLLERRLDATLYRGGMASSRDQARQLVNHGHVWVNGRRVDIASYMTKPGDVIEFKGSAQNKKGIQAIVEENGKRDLPSWIEKSNKQLKVIDSPKRDEMEQEMRMHLIVEFYSR